ncbi:alanine--tRNA ligase [candidate division KSB1 bacterium]|nr:alanine--tRNA ligase [candidate division KSB1 bacterium]
MKAADVRETFIHFFKAKNHKFVPSSPVVPFDDPSLLFTNAGMNQFKNIFLGSETREYRRAVNSQKCIRVSGKHNDLEEVGKDTYHHTFFEMLGNWSFGDYYKKEAISWAWELLTDVWKLPKEKLYATVFRDDDEAETLWRQMTDIDPSHVLRFDEKDNFWEMGEIGPCGPCSEIHIDLGAEACDKQHVPGHTCAVNAGCSRYIELWNLVFIQYNREQDGSLSELKDKHIDTGMGFERMTAVLQGVKSNYDSDLFTPIIARLVELSGKEYDSNDRGIPHRVIADHVRALTFAIADGALPSNEGRGYVLRRILRRAARFARKLNVHEPIIYKLVPVVVDIMGDAFPEIEDKHQYVSMVIKAEEESFNNTVDRGIELFDKLIRELKKGTRTVVPGHEAFRLYDTYGFPLDLTQLMAEENGFIVDIEGFQEQMEQQRKRAREAGTWHYAIDFNYETWKTITTGPDSEFVGYNKLQDNAIIRKVKVEDDLIFLTLDKSPFYGESGGQIGDRGKIVGDLYELDVLDTMHEGEKIVHIAKGQLPAGEINPAVTAQVDKRRRMSTARNHTATHLLQAALRKVLGKHVHQSGSFVSPERLRFDLTHFEKISSHEIDEIERIVNEKIMENIPVEATELTLKHAREQGAMMLFGEKYGERVRMIVIDDFSKELCGGTHLTNTGQMGSFRIVSESSVASGVRRIEAVTGEESLKVANHERRLVEQIKEKLSVPEDQVIDKLDQLVEERRKLEKELERIKAQSSHQEIVKLVDHAVSINGFKMLVGRINTPDVNTLKNTGDQIRDRLKSGIAVLASEIDGKINFLCVVTDDLIENKKLHAGHIVKMVAEVAGGSGGGRPHLALAGAKDASKVDAALNSAQSILKELLGQS